MNKNDFLRSLAVPYDDYRELRKIESREKKSASQPEPASTWEALEGEGQLAVDVFETDHDIVITAAVAGVAENDLDIHVTGDTVTIRGTRHDSLAEENRSYYYRECWFGAFSRTIVLPVHVVGNSADASLSNGLLTVRIPKAVNDLRLTIRSEE